MFRKKNVLCSLLVFSWLFLGSAALAGEPTGYYPYPPSPGQPYAPLSFAGPTSVELPATSIAFTWQKPEISAGVEQAVDGYEIFQWKLIPASGEIPAYEDWVSVLDITSGDTLTGAVEGTFESDATYYFTIASYLSAETTAFVTKIYSPYFSPYVTIGAAEAYAKGDANGDETIDATDALYILHYFAGNIGSEQLKGDCDVDNSETIDATDALYVLHYFAGNISSF